MPARPARLICLHGLDGPIKNIPEPHIVQDHEVSHRIVFIQATSGIGYLGDVSVLTDTLLEVALPMIVSTPRRFMSRTGNVTLLIEYPS